jgi:hydroxymethylpyrimidine pyrophosphatase-like HAD family hydrolase
VVEAVIASQGALTGRYSSTGVLTVLAREPMAVRDALALVRSLPRAVSANWFRGERWLVERLDRRIQVEASIVGFAPEVVDLSDEVDGPEKVLLLADAGRGDLDGLALPTGLQAVRSTPTHLEVTRRGVDKAAALAHLCAALGIQPSRVAAMGDGRNDLPLLAFAGIALAPGNAAAEVLRAADLVTSSNDDDAVAQAVDLLLRG